MLDLITRRVSRKRLSPRFTFCLVLLGLEAAAMSGCASAGWKSAEDPAGSQRPVPVDSVDFTEELAHREEQVLILQELLETRRQALRQLGTGSEQELRLPDPGVSTPVSIRLIVNIEETGGQSTTVLDSLFNEAGRPVQIETRDQHLASMFYEGIRFGASADDCWERCKRHVDSGNAPKYGVCWWGCWIVPQFQQSGDSQGLGAF